MDGIKPLCSGMRQVSEAEWLDYVSNYCSYATEYLSKLQNVMLHKLFQGEHRGKIIAEVHYQNGVPKRQYFILEEDAIPKPRVIVIRAQGKPLFVYLKGRMFISSFSWERLQQKHNCDLYKPLTDTLIQRLGL